MKRSWLIILFFVYIIAAFMVFPLPRSGGFASDDWDWLLAASQSGIAPDLTTNYLGTHEGGSYNPVSSLWVQTVYRIFGLNPVPFHIASRLLHGLTAFLVALLVLRVTRLFSKPSGARRFAAGMGFLFLLWPTHAEAIQWVAAVPHLLAAFFSLLTLIMYLSWRESGGRWGFIVVIALGAAALFSKESALTVPLIILCVEWMIRKHLTRRTVRARIMVIGGLWLVAAVYVIARFSATGVLIGNYAEQRLIMRPYQWINTFLTFFIEYVSLGTARVPWMHWFWGQPAIASLIGLSIVICFWWLIHRLRSQELLFWWYVLLLSILPFITLGFNRLSQEGERYTYFPSVFFLLLVGAAIRQYAHRFRIILYVLVIFATIQPLAIRNQAWQEAFRVSESIIEEVAALPNITDPAQQYIFVGLPDTIGGAHVSRNSLVSAIALRRGSDHAGIVLAPIYTQVPIEDADKPVLDWTADDRGLFARNEDHRFVVTGRDRQETTFFTYELWNYDYRTFSSDTIRLIYTETMHRGLSDNSISIQTWDGKKLRDLSRLTPDAVPL